MIHWTNTKKKMKYCTTNGKVDNFQKGCNINYDSQDNQTGSQLFRRLCCRLYWSNDDPSNCREHSSVNKFLAGRLLGSSWLDSPVREGLERSGVLPSCGVITT